MQITLPEAPHNNSIGNGVQPPREISGIQIAVMTGLVPPGSDVLGGTIRRMLVVVPVERRKSATLVVSQAIVAAATERAQPGQIVLLGFATNGKAGVASDGHLPGEILHHDGQLVGSRVRNLLKDRQ